jgi:hypothetical protein
MFFRLVELVEFVLLIARVMLKVTTRPGQSSPARPPAPLPRSLEFTVSRPVWQSLSLPRRDLLWIFPNTWPSLSADPGFSEQVGMVLVHNGVVRVWPRRDERKAAALEVEPDQEAIESIRRDCLIRPGFFEIVIEARPDRVLQLPLHGVAEPLNRMVN